LAPVAENPTLIPTAAKVTSTPSLPQVTDNPTSNPTAAPVTSNPTLAPVTENPTLIPTAAKVTSTPSLPQVTYNPTSNPTAAPVTSNPTLAPFTKTPPSTPNTADPTASPVTSNPTPTPVTVNPPASSQITYNPTAAPEFDLTTVSPVVSAGDDSRLIAYVGNWDPCPEESQWAQYSHIVIAFAVTYEWNAVKNICSRTCEIKTPPVCNDQANPELIQQWKDAGKSVILSFGGAGMGGSWAGDVNNCWDYCFGRETQVVARLVGIVDEMGLDGVDVDYEYFFEDNQRNSGFTLGNEAQSFLTVVTTGLRNSLSEGSIVTHAPMDADLVPGTAYYDVLVNIASSLDFLMPQYYNGIVRSVSDFAGALSHFTTLTNKVFGGDPTKVVFGFCLSECAGYNTDGDQAASVMRQLSQTYSCNGGAFFWSANADISGNWSDPVFNELQPSFECAGPPTTTGPTAPRTSFPSSPSTPTPTSNKAQPNPTLTPITDAPTLVQVPETPTLAPVTANPTDNLILVPVTDNPTPAPTVASTPSPIGQCIVTADTEKCNALLETTPILLESNCDCLTFCGGQYMGCCPYGVFCSQQSCQEGKLVAGCTFEGSSISPPSSPPDPTLAPNDAPTSVPTEPSAQTTTTSSTLVPMCLNNAGENAGQCPSLFVQNQETLLLLVEECDCYNFCGGEFMGCCPYGEVCDDVCPGKDNAFVGGCELDDAASALTRTTPPLPMAVRLLLIILLLVVVVVIVVVASSSLLG
jgi:hypothetical protein